MEHDVLLEMKNISKEFPGVKALDNVSLTVRRGTVHALMGENGAGKSTLMKCLFGMYVQRRRIHFSGRERNQFQKLQGSFGKWCSNGSSGVEPGPET